MDELLDIEDGWYSSQTITTDQIQWLIDQVWTLRNRIMHIEHPAGSNL